MLRVDEEDIAEVGAMDEARLVEHILAAMVDVSAIVLSDYGKGSLTRHVLAETIRAARERGIPVLVDPKHRDMSRYRGATCITPNAGELTLATGLPTETDDDVEKAARALIGFTDSQFVLATRSEKGMSLVPREGETLHLRAHKRAVFDVSRCRRYRDRHDGARAGGRGRLGQRRVARELRGRRRRRKAWNRDMLPERARVRDQRGSFRLGRQATGHGRGVEDRGTMAPIGLRVGFTNGCFDLLHPGHVSLLRKSRDSCDRLVVGLNSDASVKRLKGETRPLQNEALEGRRARGRLVGGLGCCIR